MQRLTAVPLAGHATVLPPGWDHASARQALDALLAQAGAPESIGLFAEAVPTVSELVFNAPDGRVARFAELDTAGRTMLRSELGRLASTLRRTAERAAQRDPAGSGRLPALVAAAIEVPSFEFVFAHEGRPVLTAWGMTPASLPGGAGLIRSLDDGRPAERPQPVPWAMLGAGAAMLTLLGAAAAVATTWIGGPTPGALVCRIEPNDLDATLGLLREQQREQLLRRRLASLQDDLGRRRATCPLPEPPPLPPQAALEPPPPPPPVQSRPEPEPPPAPPLPRPPARPPERLTERPPAQPPPNTEPCNTDTQSGGRGITETRHYLGPTPGRVTLAFNTRLEPDRIRVYQRGRLLAETPSFVSGGGAISFDWNPPPGSVPEDQVVTVEVTGTPGSRSTVWNYRLACPNGGR